MSGSLKLYISSLIFKVQNLLGLQKWHPVIYFNINQVVFTLELSYEELIFQRKFFPASWNPTSIFSFLTDSLEFESKTAHHGIALTLSRLIILAYHFVFFFTLSKKLWSTWLSEIMRAWGFFVFFYHVLLCFSTLNIKSYVLLVKS
jgi:hypothetical protein